MNWYDTLESILSPTVLGLVVSAGIGLIIGLEREFNTHQDATHLGGIRTFVLVAILGNTSGWLAMSSTPLLWVLAGGFCALVAMAYYLQAAQGKMGLTTEIALLLTFLLGLANAYDLRRESLAVVVLMTTVLSLKQKLHGFIRQITEEELFAFLKFIVLALLVLPMLPDTSFGPEDMLNVRDMGWIVILVLSISFSGYLLLKFGSPKRGILFTAFIGGLFSSTLVAWIFSAKSRERQDLSAMYGAGIVLASTIMFLRVLVLTSVFAPQLSLRLLIPLLLMALVSLLPTWQAVRAPADQVPTPELSPGNPLDIRNALFFVVLYIGISFFMFGSRYWLGPTLTYVSGAIAGIADIDAITISTSKWTLTPGGQVNEAAIIVLLAVMSNSIFKISVSVLNGARAMRPSVILGFGPTLLIGVGTLLVWLMV